MGGIFLIDNTVEKHCVALIRPKETFGLPNFGTIVATAHDYPCCKGNIVKGQETMELIDLDKVRDLVMRERDLAVSEREWKHRVRGYGYGIRDTAHGRVVSSLVKKRDLLTLGFAG